MQIKVTGHRIEITPALRDYVHEKIGKLEQFFSNIQKIEVILDAREISEKKRRQVAEIRAWMAGFRIIQALEAGQDMYAAIDLVFEEAKRQIERHKEKHVQEQRRKAEKLKQAARTLPPIEIEAGPTLVKLSRFARKPMDFEEAKAELGTLDQDFLAFHNRESGEINVILKNKEKYELLSADKEMTPEEAMEEIRKNNLNLIFFNNPKTRTPTVIFRRKSGNFGLIEPEY